MKTVIFIVVFTVSLSLVAKNTHSFGSITWQITRWEHQCFIYWHWLIINIFSLCKEGNTLPLWKGVKEGEECYIALLFSSWNQWLLTLVSFFFLKIKCPSSKLKFSLIPLDNSSKILWTYVKHIAQQLNDLPESLSCHDLSKICSFVESLPKSIFVI